MVEKLLRSQAFASNEIYLFAVANFYSMKTSSLSLRDFPARSIRMPVRVIRFISLAELTY